MRATNTLQVELFRKAIHVSIAIVPALAAVSMSLANSVLLIGMTIYVAAESARRGGVTVSVISRLTVLAARGREEDAFVLGPVTLGLGALAALQLYPEPAASIAIYALAFGDSAASIVGTAFGRLKIPFTGGKSVAGSVACCVVVFVAALRITGRPGAAGIIALAAAAVEAAPTRDFDNLILPAGTGLVAAYLLL
jgi:dolichol kinase